MVPRTTAGHGALAEEHPRRSNSNTSHAPEVILLFHLVVTLLMLYATCNSMLVSATSSYSGEICGVLLTVGIPIILMSFRGLQKNGAMERIFGWLIVTSPIFNMMCLAAVYVLSSTSPALVSYADSVPLFDMMILVALQCISSSRLRYFSSKTGPKGSEHHQHLGRLGAPRVPKEVWNSAITHSPVNKHAPSASSSSPVGDDAQGESAINRRNRKVRNPVRHLPYGHKVYSGNIVSYLPEREIGFVTADNGDFVADLYFKVTTMTKEVQELGKNMIGTHVDFVVRYRADGTPQIRAAMPTAPGQVIAQLEKLGRVQQLTFTNDS